MIRKSYYIKVLLVFIISNLTIAQSLSTSKSGNDSLLSPKLVHYDRNDFNADPQFWTMCENNDGTLLFGNNDGALSFDGEHWNKIYLPNNSSVRSLVKGQNGIIYAGGYNELGTLQKNKYGKYFYKSLINEFHLEDKNIENLWQVHQVSKLIVFRSFTELIVINGNTVTQLPANKYFLYSEIINGNYYVQDADFGIYKLDTSTLTLQLVFKASLYTNEDIASIVPNQNKEAITFITKSGNVYIGNTKNKSVQKAATLFDSTKKDQVSFAIQTKPNEYLIGTRSSKVIKLHASAGFTKENALFPGLSSATIHYIFKTNNNNIWILQNNGLNFLDFKSPFISIFDQASIYDILVKNNTIYTATSNGVYYAPFSSNTKNNAAAFKKIEDLQGQAWAVQAFDNSIIISHDTGIYKFANGTAVKIGTENGFWKLTKIKNLPNRFLASNYNGLYIVENNNGNWSIKNKIKGFDESSRDILADNQPNTYWICHGYKGVYKVHINNDYSRIDVVDHFTDKNGFKSAYNINVFRWNNKIVFTTNTGIYYYNSSNNKFEPYNPLNSLFDTSKNTRKIIQTKQRTWFIQDDEAGFFDANNPTLNKDLFINLKGTFNRGMESIYPIGENKVLFGTNSGIFEYSLKGIHNQVTLPTIISQITYSHNQKLVSVEINSNENNIDLPNQTDILRFEFSCPKMISSTATDYSYKLENMDENWSPWQKNAFKEYTHLRPDTYTFIVRSRNLAGLVGTEKRIEFTILPKWYQTNLAYFVYLIVAFFCIYFLYKYVKKKIAYERLKSKIEIKKTQQLLELELEKLTLKHDKELISKDKISLEYDIIDKSKELANYTLMLSHKKNIFSELQNDLKQLRDLLKSEEARKKITEIFQKLNQHRIGEEYMEIFDVNFEKIHQDFFEKLKKIDATLTKRELRLCAFIKMDLTNKEIAPLLTISTRGIESARYRVRKKLNVQHDDNLVAFLENLNKTE